jgi:peptidoglycan/LPS O-acetylase OafA/YrhL
LIFFNIGDTYFEGLKPFVISFNSPTSTPTYSVFTAYVFPASYAARIIRRSHSHFLREPAFAMADYLRSQIQKGKSHFHSLFDQWSFGKDSEGLSHRLLSNDETDLDNDDEVNINEKQRQRFDVSQVPWIGRVIFAVFHFILYALTPSFIYNLFITTEPRRLHKTSFLDGLRGAASFTVAVSHLVLPQEPWLLPSYGVDNHDGMGSNILQLPFIRVMFSGKTMVHIFFVISGYVLSTKQIRLIRSGQREKLGDSLVSFIFRRGLRLFLPSLVGQVLKDIFHYSWYWNFPAFWPWVRNVFSVNAYLLLYYWDWDMTRVELMQLWTIPVEFICSMFLFVVILGVSRVRTWLRFAIIGVLVVHSHACGHWAPVLFLSGMAIAEIDAIIDERAAKRQASGIKQEGRGQLWKSILHTFVWVTVLLIGLFLAGWPETNGAKSFVFKHLIGYTPAVYLRMREIYTSFFWLTIGCSLILLSLCRLPLLQKIFTRPLTQYLGDISYSVYIVHYVIVLLLRPKICYYAYTWAGGYRTQWQRILLVFFEALLLMIIVVWVADIFWRFVDRPVVKFSRWLEKICQKPDQAETLG